MPAYDFERAALCSSMPLELADISPLDWPRFEEDGLRTVNFGPGFSARWGGAARAVDETRSEALSQKLRGLSAVGTGWHSGPRRRLGSMWAIPGVERGNCAGYFGLHLWAHAFIMSAPSSAFGIALQFREQQFHLYFYHWLLFVFSPLSTCLRVQIKETWVSGELFVLPVACAWWCLWAVYACTDFCLLFRIFIFISLPY